MNVLICCTWLFNATAHLRCTHLSPQPRTFTMASVGQARRVMEWLQRIYGFSLARQTQPCKHAAYYSCGERRIWYTLAQTGPISLWRGLRVVNSLIIYLLESLTLSVDGVRTRRGCGGPARFRPSEAFTALQCVCKM